MKPQNSAKAIQSRGKRHEYFQHTQRGQDPNVCQRKSPAGRPLESGGVGATCSHWETHKGRERLLVFLAALHALLLCCKLKVACAVLPNHHFNLQPLVKADGLEHADRSFPTQFRPRLFIDRSLTASGTRRELLPPCRPAVLQLPSCIPARLQNRLSGRAPWFRQLQKEVLCLTPHASWGRTIAREKKEKSAFSFQCHQKVLLGVLRSQHRDATYVHRGRSQGRTLKSTQARDTTSE